MAEKGNLRIRALRSSDVATICQLSEDLGLSRWSDSDLIEELERAESLMLLAELDQQTVGFIVGRQVPGTDEGRFDAEIYNIGVAARFHKKGIGSKLLERFLEWAQVNRVVNVWLEVRAANLSARSFYKRNGFEEIITRKRFYNAPVDDAIIMKAEVSGYYNVLNKESLK